MENQTEIWKDIEGYEGLYQVSNTGKIKSLARVLINSGIHPLTNKKESILKPNIDVYGYATISLYKNAIAKRFKIHRLVAIHFINIISSKDVVNHKDSNRLNNNVYNLEWVTTKENVLHSMINGNRDISILHNSNKKLTYNDIEFIRNNKHLKAKELAVKYNVTDKCIYSILNYKTWKDA